MRTLVIGAHAELAAQDTLGVKWELDPASAWLVNCSALIKSDLMQELDATIPRSDRSHYSLPRKQWVAAVKTVYSHERNREAEYRSAYYRYPANYSREQIAAMMEAEARGESYVDLLKPEDRRRKKSPEN